MPTFVRERFLSFSGEFALGSTRVASNPLVREMGKITHLSLPLGFFPQATLAFDHALTASGCPPHSGGRAGRHWRQYDPLKCAPVWAAIPQTWYGAIGILC